ncbi:flagellar filament capping protein FliD [Candidatus Poribacteria bacterium]|nr:flagellar filament capping protein FliD [Candidatus Poribacteria bacterium]
MNISGISFSGLISGLDTKSIIDQLMQVAQRPIDMIEDQKSQVEDKISAWQEVNTRLAALSSAVSSLADSSSFRQYRADLSDSDLFSVSLSSNAAPGLYTVEVLQLAASEQISSDSFSDTSSGLGLEGEFLINGVRIDVEAYDSLVDIKDEINSANAGVTAAIINISDTDHRLVITSNQTGSEGIDLAEVSGDVLKSLGFINDTTSLKHPLGEGAETDPFADITSPIGTLLNLTTPPSGVVTIGDKTISIDLSTDSLQSIKEKIEAASPTGVTVALVEDTSSGTTRYKLQITGTTQFSDDNNVLQVLGILESEHANQLQEGADAKIKLNGIEIARSSNTIDDAIDGITLNLQKAEPGRSVTMEVSLDVDAIKGLIQDFVDAYNDLASYINEQFDYDVETGQGGTLLGDATLLTIHSRLRSILINEISEGNEDLTALVHIGIASDGKGILSIDDSKLTSAIQNNLDQVINLFAVQQGSATGKIEYLSHTRATKPGTYNVVITQAAKRASVTGSTPIQDGGLSQDEALTITELASGTSETVQLYAGDTIDTIVDRINSLLHQRVAQVLTSDTANTTDGTTPITGNTTFGEIFGANVSNGDTITISGTDRDGNQISRTFTINDVNTTRISDLLNEIQNAFSGEVTATVDSNGRLVITDNTPGESDISLQLTYDGDGNLDFGTFQITTQGRYEIPITASNDGGKLKLTHDYYGSSMGFSVVSNVEDLGDGSSTGIGTDMITDYGQDVAGTINGEPASGNGQYLSGLDTNENTAGLRLKVKVTPEDLAENGGTYQATVTLTFGVAEQLDNLLDYLTDSADGLMVRHQKALQDQIDELDDRIQSIQERLDMERERLENMFVELERAMNELTAQGDYLLTQIAKATGTNTNNTQRRSVA